MTAISDPSRPSRRDRRRAQKLVDTAFAEGRLTAADRTLRTQRIEAAHTRGDLTMIARDIVAPAETNLGRALDSSTMASMRAGTSGSRGMTSRIPGVPSTVGSTTPTVDLSGIGRKVRLFVVLAMVGVFASCVLGLMAFIVPAVLEFQRDVKVATPSAPSASASSEPNGRQAPGDGAEDGSANLHTVAGWTALVEAIESASGTTQVYDLVAYPQYASVGMDGKDAVERRLYRNGAWQDTFSARTPVTGSLIDLAEIDAEVIAGLPAETAEHFGIAEPTGTYIIVNAFAGDPRIMVYVQSGGQSNYRAYSLGGAPIS